MINEEREKELKERSFQKFLKENGPNPGEGYFKQLAWQTIMREKFEQQYGKPKEKK